MKKFLAVCFLLLAFTTIPPQETFAATPSNTVKLKCIANTKGPLRILSGFFKSKLYGTNIKVSVRAKRVEDQKTASVNVNNLAGVASAYAIYFNPVTVVADCSQRYSFSARVRVPYAGTIEVNFGTFSVPGYFQ